MGRRVGASRTSASIERLLDTDGEQTLSSHIITADRGYGRETFATYVRSKGIGSIFFMLEYHLKVHPFVPASFLSAGWADTIDAFNNSAENFMDGDDYGEGSDGDYAGQAESSSFVVRDGWKK